MVEIDPSAIPFTSDKTSRAQIERNQREIRRRQNMVPIGERSARWWIGVAVFLVATLVLYVVFSRLGWIQKLKNLGFRAGRRRV